MLKEMIEDVCNTKIETEQGHVWHATTTPVTTPLTTDKRGGRDFKCSQLLAVQQRLLSKGADVLGSGAFAVAYLDHETTLVHKLSEHDDYSVYLQVLSEAKHLAASPHAPKIKMVSRYEDGGFHAALEKLECTVSEARERFGHEAALAMGLQMEVAQKLLVRGTNGLLNIEKDTWKHIPNSLVIFYLGLKDYLDRNCYGVSWDLHSGNFMIREERDGRLTLVLTDPWISCKKY